MNKNVLRYFGKALGLNLLGGAAVSLPLVFLKSEDQIGWLIVLLVIAGLSLFTQLIAAIIYTNNPAKKEKGQGMLLCVGLFLLIGAAVCGPMWF